MSELEHASAERRAPPPRAARARRAKHDPLAAAHGAVGNRALGATLESTLTPEAKVAEPLPPNHIPELQGDSASFERDLQDTVIKGITAINAPHPPNKGLWYYNMYHRQYKRDLAKGGKKGLRWEDHYFLGHTECDDFEAPSEERHFDWKLKEGRSASKAIKRWFAGLTIADCASAAVAVLYDTIRRAVSDKTFDELFGEEGKPTPGPYRMRIAQYSLELDVFLETLSGKTQVQPGDWTYFANTPEYGKKHPAGVTSGENVIRTRDKRWTGFGPKSASDAALYKRMLVGYNRPRDTFDEKVIEARGLASDPAYRYTSQGGTLKERYKSVEDLRRAGAGIHDGMIVRLRTARIYAARMGQIKRASISDPLVDMVGAAQRLLLLGLVNPALIPYLLLSTPEGTKGSP